MSSLTYTIVDKKKCIYCIYYVSDIFHDPPTVTQVLQVLCISIFCQKEGAGAPMLIDSFPLSVKLTDLWGFLKSPQY